MARPSRDQLAAKAAAHPYLALTILTVACLLPFSGRAFHIDDTLFLWAAQHIVHHPFDPYGFSVVWYRTAQAMSDVTKNPPLACYSLALAGSIGGWSERWLHLVSMSWAIALVLGTYRLAVRLAVRPMIAAIATLLTPAVLVAASSVMCDVPMLAFWVWAVVFWVEGIEPIRFPRLLISALLISAAVLTKYFAMALLPLLFVFTIVRRRSVGSWAAFFVIPIAVLAGYQSWTRALYGRGLVSDAFAYAHTFEGPPKAHGVVFVISILFAGACTLLGLSLAGRLWSRTQLLFGISAGAVAALLVGMQVVKLGEASHSFTYALQVGLWTAAGISLLGLIVAELWSDRTAETLLLALWIFGTYFFAGFLNWTNNSRSILPLVPAAAILAMRRIHRRDLASGSGTRSLAFAMIFAAIVSLWVAAGDAEMANADRTAATQIAELVPHEAKPMVFQGHWGFEYYMKRSGFRPFDIRETFGPGDLIVVPENSDGLGVPIPQQMIASTGSISVPLHAHVSTSSFDSGAGFYSSTIGALPFYFGKIAPERFSLIRLGTPPRNR